MSDKKTRPSHRIEGVTHDLHAASSILRPRLTFGISADFPMEIVDFSWEIPAPHSTPNFKVKVVNRPPGPSQRVESHRSQWGDDLSQKCVMSHLIFFNLLSFCLQKISHKVVVCCSRASAEFISSLVQPMWRIQILFISRIRDSIQSW